MDGGFRVPHGCGSMLWKGGIAVTTTEREQWLKDRQSGIGASDAANLIGVGYRSAGDVYRDKTEPVDARLPSAGPLRRGMDLETIVTAMYEEQMGTRLVTPGGILASLDLWQGITRHPLRPWQFASLDRRRADTGATVSLKTNVGFGDDWGEVGSADVPAGYTAQSQHEMGVTGTMMLDLAVLDVIRWEVRVYRLEFDPAYYLWLTEVEERFWTEHVQTKNPPPADWDDRINPPTPLVVRPGTIDLGPEAAELLAKRKRIIAIRDEADEAVRTLTEQVVGMLGTSEKGVAGGFTVKRIFVRGGAMSYTRKDNWQVRVTGKGES